MKLSQLEVLFGSRVRVKLIKVFLKSPDSAFYGRQLQRKIKEEHKAIWQELRDLEEVGFLASEMGGRTKRYKMKKFTGWQTLAQFLLYPETPPDSEQIDSLALYYMFLLIVTGRQPTLPN